MANMHQFKPAITFYFKCALPENHNRSNNTTNQDLTTNVMIFTYFISSENETISYLKFKFKVTFTSSFLGYVCEMLSNCMNWFLGKNKLKN